MPQDARRGQQGPRPDPLEGFRLDGRAAIVTGASSGLGRRFAEVLAAAGTRLTVAARRGERLESLAGDLRADGAEVLSVALDYLGDGKVTDTEVAVAAGALKTTRRGLGRGSSRGRGRLMRKLEVKAASVTERH